MKREELFKAIGDVDDEIITKSKEYKPSVWSFRRKCAAVAAACLCLAIVGAGIVVLFPDGDNGNTGEVQMAQGTDKGESAGHSDKGGITDNSDGAEYSDNSGLSDIDNDSKNINNEITEKDDIAGIQIPQIELPKETQEGVSADMIGLVVYKGLIYTQAESYYSSEEVAKIEPLLGDRLGHAKGNIDEWSSQDDYAAELASTYEGDVYTVKGYSPDFRLCIVSEYEEDGKMAKTLQFMEVLSGIEVASGADMFEDRLKITGNIASATYLTHDDWNNGNMDNIRKLKCTDEQLDAFCLGLSEGRFEYAYETNPDIYDSSNQAHVCLTLADGTRVNITLIEGGYVGYQSMGWYFVKVRDEVFKTVFEACK